MEMQDVTKEETIKQVDVGTSGPVRQNQAKEEAESSIYSKLKGPSEDIYAEAFVAQPLVKQSPEEAEPSIYSKLKGPSEDIYAEAFVAQPLVKQSPDKDEGMGNVRVYRAGCIFLSISCLFLLLVILILGIKHFAGPVGCPERVPEGVMTKYPQVCSFQTCKAQFPQFEDQKSGCQQCAKDWVAFEGSCFYFSVERQNWEGGKKTCSDKGGDLAVIPNLKVQNFLSTNGSLMYWIGLRNQANGWTWVNNTALGESYWSENLRDGDCGILIGGDPPGKSWMKAPCGVKTYYICQRHHL